ncbi:TRL-like family protein [Leptospira barantonii]|uniref:TRL-like family protein n=1 Tax=Leptospira barantonii TaxID=2023184 RepID=A0A5F2BN99_9LEPT|nr:TRL-like family protein [Leptospira barantonii]TGM07026.1 TRL-like family protein [Leptospira barantonii]
MKRILNILLLLFLILSLTRCAAGPVGGFLFTHNKYPGEINPTNEVRSDVSAEGCIHSVLGLFSFGNAGAGSVAKKNGIQRIAIIDYSVLQILAIVYRNHCVIVSGEKE